MLHTIYGSSNPDISFYHTVNISINISSILIKVGKTEKNIIHEIFNNGRLTNS